MGLEIERDQFQSRDYDRFADRLASCLGVLEELLARPGFGRGPAELGAELELALIDDGARALPLNEEVLRETVDERMTVELDRFNLECNLLHSDLAGRPFAHMRREIESARKELARAAAVHGGRIAIGGARPAILDWRTGRVVHRVDAPDQKITAGRSVNLVVTISTDQFVGTVVAVHSIIATTA